MKPEPLAPVKDYRAASPFPSAWNKQRRYAKSAHAAVQNPVGVRRVHVGGSLRVHAAEQ